METDDLKIDAGEALDRLESQLGGRASAKTNLAEMLRDGKITSWASQVFVSGLRDLDNVWALGPEEGLHIAYDHEIDPDEWWDSLRWADDIGIWRWPTSQFLVTTRNVPLVRNYYDGVTFSLREIELLEAGERLLGKPNSGRGRRPDLQRWEKFWMAVVQVARDGKLVPGQIATQKDLREELLFIMEGDPLSEDSIKDPVRRVWAKFCEI